MRSFNFNLNLSVAVLGAAVLLPPSSSMADNDVWKTAANGAWGAGGNWVDGSTPSSIVDDATFSSPGAYTVSFSGDPNAIGDLTVTGGANVTFASTTRPGNPIVPRTLHLDDGHPFRDGGVLVNGAALTLGSTTTGVPFHLTADGGVVIRETSTLNLKFGSVVTSFGSTLSGVVNVDSGSLIQSENCTFGTTAAVTVSGVGSRLKATTLLEIGRRFLSDPGIGSALSIAGGGQVECARALVGGTFSPTSIVTVTGDDSLWTTTGVLQIGDQSAATVNIQPGGTVSVGQRTAIGAGGRLNLQGGTLDTNELTVEGGQFQWSAGTLHVGAYFGELNHSAGTLAPGHSAGVTTVTGDYLQGANATLEIEIGGAAQGTQYDVVNVLSQSTISGHLDVQLISGFTPTPSQTFVIFSATTIGGSGFSNVASGQRLAMDGGGTFRVDYGPGSAFAPNLVVLSAFQPGAAGDYDGDGDADGRDFLVWQRGGSPNPNSAADLADWNTNFGRTSATPAGAAVPEPHALALCSMGAVAWAMHRSRRAALRSLV